MNEYDDAIRSHIDAYALRRARGRLEALRQERFPRLKLAWHGGITVDCTGGHAVERALLAEAYVRILLEEGLTDV